ncbi:AAA family ATPase [Microbacterium lacticum]
MTIAAVDTHPAPARTLYLDIAQLLAGPVEAPSPTIGTRSDGAGLLYAGAVNVLFGPPESGKTLVASSIAADIIHDGGSALVIDTDHNGPHATIARFLAFGLSPEILTDPARFRYAAPEDSAHAIALAADIITWAPTVVILDSIGELLPMFGANSNDADDFTRVNRIAIQAFTRAGSAVIAIDHEAKSKDSREYGSSGTAAKKRAVDGAMIRVALRDPFTPGRGGKSALTIAKDRHGGLRATSPTGDREPLAAIFQLRDRNGALDGKLWAPEGATLAAVSPKTQADAADLDTLTPPPTSTRDVATRMRWSSRRATPAFAHWRATRTTPDNPAEPPETERYPLPGSTGKQEAGIALPATTPLKGGSGSKPTPTPTKGLFGHSVGVMG